MQHKIAIIIIILIPNEEGNFDEGGHSRKLIERLMFFFHCSFLCFFCNKHFDF